MSRFEKFLTTNHEMIVRTHLARIKDSPLTPKENAWAYTENIVDNLTGLILTKLSVDDPLIRAMRDRAQENQASNDYVTLRIRMFFETLRIVLGVDTCLSKLDQVHICRMLEQSERYMMMVIVPTYKSASIVFST